VSFVSPGQPLARISDTPAGRVVEIPAKRDVFVLGILCVWLVGWFVGWLAAASQLFGNRVPAGPLLIWLAIWTAGGAFALFAVIWGLAGREVVTAAPSSLVIERRIGSLGRARRYETSRIRDLRVSAQPYRPFDRRSGLWFWGISGGWIAFDYGASTVRFAAGLEEAEAKRVVARLLEWVPSLGSQQIAQGHPTGANP
jgi:hypothetical protein